METLPRGASAFQNTWNKTEESHSYRRAYSAGRAAFVSLSSRMTWFSARAPYGSLWLLALREGAAQAATAGRPCETRGLDDGRTKRSHRACSSVG